MDNNTYLVSQKFTKIVKNHIKISIIIFKHFVLKNFFDKIIQMNDFCIIKNTSHNLLKIPSLIQFPI